MLSINRKKLLTVGFLLAAILLLLGIKIDAESQFVDVKLKGTFHYEKVNEMVDLINAERAKVGSDPVVLDYNVTEYAMKRASELPLMFKHEKPDKVVNPYHKQENIGAADYLSVRDQVARWMDSAVHKATLLSSNAKACGIGIFQHEGEFYYTYVDAYDTTSGGNKDINKYALTKTVSLKYYVSNRMVFAALIPTVKFKSTTDPNNFGFYAEREGDEPLNPFLTARPENRVFTILSYDEDLIYINPSTLAVTGKKKGTANITLQLTGTNLTKTVQMTVLCLSNESGEGSFDVKLENIRYAYTGSEIKPKIEYVKDKYGDIMVEGRDYIVEYRNNINPGTGSVMIKGIGNYSGSDKPALLENYPFQIYVANPKNISELDIRFADGTSNFKYTGKKITPKMIVKDGNKTLVEDVDYVLTYGSNVEKSTKAMVAITGTEEFYTGSKILMFQISDSGIVPGTGSNTGGNTGSTGNTTSGGTTAPANGTVIAGGVAGGTTTKPSTGGTTTKPSTGGTTTKPSTGGTTTKPSTGGTTTKPVATTKPTATISVKSALTYNGKAQKPKVTVTYNKKKLSTKDYSVAYKANKNPGVATVTVVGKGAYKGKFTARKTFLILPKKVSIKTPSVGKGTFTAKWKSHPGVNGYQIMVSKNRRFTSGNITKTVRGTSCKVSGLPKKTKYYCRVRAYKVINGKTYYGAWSAVKNKKTK